MTHEITAKQLQDGLEKYGYGLAIALAEDNVNKGKWHVIVESHRQRKMCAN